MKYFLILILSLSSFSQGYNKSIYKKSFDEVALDVGKDYGVLFKTTHELRDSIQNYTILDARSLKEFEVSHIKNAIHIGYDGFDPKQIKSKISYSKPIVIYCGVGYRSAVAASKFMDKGYKVFKLYGGIFDWFNQGNAVVDISKRPTNRIHGFDKKWSRLIKRGEIVLN